MNRRLSPAAIDALRAVAAQRVQYGSTAPNIDRRSGRPGVQEFLLDGYEVHGAAHATYRALSERALIRECVEQVETRRVPAETRTSLGLRGQLVTELPERDVPVDPGWRVPVVLTDVGAATLAEIEACP